ncbi:hypothetical protein NAP1_14953 [Erythrobacter sp. NAP1]|uniref:flagellar protein FliS n=1 Tax=Erythrobacter sp. NAP1 TaxID=237727 RepID=UPI0000687647|nr:flagellar protein FliS [Erythrobacter sp. NAP1]EAQ28908.1 hypothetical protein NAP1_14953 [Erythrobacter sp. NAP1]
MMHEFATSPAKAYRRIDLDARIEASSGGELTLICLEEVVAALGQALFALERAPDEVPNEPLARAHGIAIWLARSVAPDNPMRSALVQFYGGLVTTLTRNRVRPSVEELTQVRTDFADLLEAAKSA